MINRNANVNIYDRYKYKYKAWGKNAKRCQNIKNIHQMLPNIKILESQADRCTSQLVKLV